MAVSSVRHGQRLLQLEGGISCPLKTGQGLGFGVLNVFRGLAVLSSTKRLGHLPGVRVARLVCHPFPPDFPPYSHLAPDFCTVLSGRAPAWLLTRAACTGRFSVPAFPSHCDGASAASALQLLAQRRD